MQISEVKNILQKHGVVGAGGAGFPSYAKLSDKAEIIILNCAECEPLFKLHRQLLEIYAEEIVSMLDVLTETVGADEFIVAVKGSYKGAVSAVNEVLKNYPKGKVKLLKEMYPAGDEVITIFESTGRVVPPGSLPIEVGCIVYNVETVLNMYNALYKNKSVTHKYVTVAGEVNNPSTYCVPIGTKFSHLIELSGGLKREDVEIISGGPMTGNISSMSDCVTKTTNGILVMPEDHYIVMKRKQNSKISVQRAMSTCCQCKSCTELCSRHLLGHPINPAEFMKCVANQKTDTRAVLNTFYCSQCGLCELYSCPQGLSPKTLIGLCKNELRNNGLKPEILKLTEEVHPDREYRLVPMKRLIERLDLSRYNTPAKITDTKVNPETVKISLSQHIGKPAAASVKEGQVVKAGEIIAECDEKALSVAYHSSIDGTVQKITDKYVIISAI